MLINFIIISFRNVFKSSSTSFINFLGLTVGLACSLLIFINVNHELTYDRFHKKADRIFRILSIDNALGVSNNVVGITIPALATGMKNELADVEEVVRISGVGKSLVKYNETTLYAEDLIYTEPSLFKVFDFQLTKGDTATCLQNPKTAVLTETMAKKIFGKEDPMGKIFSADGSEALTVTGIMKDEKRPSHFKFDVIISLNPSPSDSNTIAFVNSWNSIAMVEYVLLKNPQHKDKIISQMDTLLRHNKTLDAWKATLQPLNEVHLYSGDILFDEFNQNKGNIKYVQSLSLVAIIILLIASFNYMNLSTARSARRAKEVGVRKTIGAQRGQIVFQHLAEALLQVTLSMIVAFAAIDLINIFYPIVEPSAMKFVFHNPRNIAYVLSLLVSLGLLSGIYPALILSSYNPIVVLRGKFSGGKKGLWLRRFLVTIQFVATFVMILGTLVIMQQLHYTLTKDKGFNASQIINIQIDNQEIGKKYDALRTELQKIPGIKNVATSASMPGLGFGRRSVLPEGAQSTDTWIVSALSIDENYIPLMNMQFVEGENFRKDMPQEPISLIVNESFVRATGWKNGLNKTVELGQAKRKAVVIGVVKDFHFTSLRHKIEPVMMSYRAGVNGIVSIKIEDASISNTISSIQSTWQKVNGNVPFDYKFFDESFGKLFEKEQEFSKLFFNFTLLSIFVAILGLFGLAAYSAEQRTKEIGIRKTFGGTTTQMVLLQSREYMKLIAIATVLGIPVAVYIMKTWLQGFEYRIELGVLPFIYSIFIIFVVTLVTVSIQSFKAAEKNPVESLKYE